MHDNSLTSDEIYHHSTCKFLMFLNGENESFFSYKYSIRVYIFNYEI